MSDLSKLLSLLADNGIDLSRRNTIERMHLEEDLTKFLTKLDHDAYDKGLDRGWEMAQMTGDY